MNSALTPVMAWVLGKQRKERKKHLLTQRYNLLCICFVSCFYQTILHLLKVSIFKHFLFWAQNIEQDPTVSDGTSLLPIILDLVDYPRTPITDFRLVAEEKPTASFIILLCK